MLNCALFLTFLDNSLGSWSSEELELNKRGRNYRILLQRRSETMSVASNTFMEPTLGNDQGERTNR